MDSVNMDEAIFKAVYSITDEIKFWQRLAQFGRSEDERNRAVFMGRQFSQYEQLQGQLKNSELMQVRDFVLNTFEILNRVWDGQYKDYPCERMVNIFEIVAQAFARAKKIFLDPNLA